jgi:hypothetical protein
MNGIFLRLQGAAAAENAYICGGDKSRKAI